jgi:uncharacterized damage-inducible protein DinB
MTVTGETRTDERADLLESLARARHFLRLTVQDLSDAQAAQRSTASELCLGGIVKHVAAVEDNWARFIVEGPSAMPSFGQMTDTDRKSWSDRFRMADGETLADVLDRYEHVARRTDELIAALPDLNAAQPLPEAP